MLNCAYSGRGKLPARHLLRWDEIFLRSVLHMQGRNGATAALMRRLDALMAKQLSAQKERGHVPSV